MSAGSYLTDWQNRVYIGRNFTLRAKEIKMSGFTRSFGFLRSKLRPLTTLKANISGKPAKHTISTGEQLFVMTVMCVTILGPSGWVLAHLEEYKAR